MATFMGVEWVDFKSIPLKRRLQMVAVFLHLFIFMVFPGLAMMMLIYMLFTDYWWIAVAYASWMTYDVFLRPISSQGGRKSQWLRRSVYFRYFRDYFPISLIKTCDLDPKFNYVMGYHPHGILSCGAFANFCSEATGFSQKFPGINPHMVTLGANFRWPIIRGYALWCGLCDSSKESINYILNKQGVGNSVTIVIGGAAEALEAHPGNYKLTLKNRKGFVKLAVQAGAHLVPVFSFGENDLFQQADNPMGSTLRVFQEKFKKIMGFSPPLFHGRGVTNYNFGLIPFRTPVNTVVGKPIPTQKTANPTQEQIDTVHQQYMDSLSDLFDEHKINYGIDKDSKLEFL